MSGMDGETTVEIARLDERYKALVREVERNEDAAQRALVIATEELARRLEILNGERERELEARHTFVNRELFDSKMGGVESRVSALEGRSWILYVAAVAAVGALVAEVVRLTFHS